MEQLHHLPTYTLQIVGLLAACCVEGIESGRSVYRASLAAMVKVATTSGSGGRGEAECRLSSEGTDTNGGGD